MRWIILSLCVCTAMGLGPLCNSDLCKHTKQYPGSYGFKVDGYEVDITYGSNSSYIEINCHDHARLDGSPHMPSFIHEFHASNVELYSCPLVTSTSLVSALAALNVKIQPTNDRISLIIMNLPKTTKLMEEYFKGLEDLSNLTITTMYPILETPVKFFNLFTKLRSLTLRGVILTAGGLYDLPKTLDSLHLHGYSLKILSSRILPEVQAELLSALPKLVTVSLQEGVWPDGSHRTAITTNIPKVLTNATSSLEVLTIYSWPEMTVLEQCEKLLILKIATSNLTHLPDRFVAACPRLEELNLGYNEMNVKVPAKLLEGANALKRFSFRSCKIRTLPEGFFQGAPKLIKIDLSHNYFKSFPSDVFLNLPLESLLLRDNLLNEFKMATDLAKLTSLTELDLAFNEFGDFCDEKNGDSPLATLTKLKKLDLSYNNKISRICRDWRQKLTFLEDLNVWSNGMTELKFDDFQFTRDPSVENSKLYLGKSIKKLDFTKNDYEKTLIVPKPGFKVIFNFDGSPEINCDCSVRWFRLTMEKAKPVINISGLLCSNKRPIHDVKPEEMCPELPTSTTKRPS